MSNEQNASDVKTQALAKSEGETATANVNELELGNAANVIVNIDTANAVAEELQNENEKQENVAKNVNDDNTLVNTPPTATTIAKTTTSDSNECTAAAAAEAQNAATQKVLSTTLASVDNDEYAEHITYTPDGNAIYTDPKTNYKYKWCTEQNNWVACDKSIVDDNKTDVSNAKTTSDAVATANPYENEHYKWCSATQQWLLKTQATETEHYKWDAEKNEWLPKTQPSTNSTSITTSATTSTNDTATATATTTTTLTRDTKSSTTDVACDIDADGQRIYTDKDGAVYFWDVEKNAWFPKIDDDFMARYQMNYGFIDNTSASENEKLLKVQAEEERKAEELKCMAEEAKAAMAATAANATAEAAGGGKRKAPQEPPKWFDLDPEHNTKVYVSNLPLDITIDEFAELMNKCGMIMRDPQTQKYKLKLYTETDGQIKGDGLCDYIKVESVDLALNILDEYNLRGNKIRVQRAKFQMRGEYNPALKPKRKKKDKEKLQKLKEKLFDWRPEKLRGERTKNEKIVIIKNLFQPEIFEKEVQLILDYQNDIREECSKCGTVRKVVLYDRHAEGVAQVNMSTPEEADLVIQMMHGRYFGKRQLSAESWDGKTKYKIDESETEVQKRLSKWDQFLETDEDKKEKKSENLIENVATENVNLTESA